MEKNELNLQNVPKKKGGQVDRGGRFSTAVDFFFLAPLVFFICSFFLFFFHFSFCLYLKLMCASVVYVLPV